MRAWGSREATVEATVGAAVKRCPYCAEEIQDQAVICRFCGRPQPSVPAAPAATDPPTAAEQAPPTDPPVATDPPPAGGPGAPVPTEAPAALPGPSTQGPVVGEGAVRFSHSGYRYILGYGLRLFGIWDRNVPGGPVFSFPRTDEGWEQAWNRFVVLEPKAVEVPAMGAPPDVRATSTHGYRSGRVLVGWIVALIAIVAVLAGGSIIARSRYLVLIHQALDGRDVSLSDQRDAVNAINSLVALYGLGILAAGIVWLIWQFRAQSNLRALGVANLRFSPGWVVGWWIIPVANLAMPYLTVRELYKGSEPGGGAVDWMSARTAATIPLWWAAWLLQNVLAIAGSTVSAGTKNPTWNQLATREPIEIASVTMLIVAAVLAIVLVRRIDRRQEAKRQRVAAFEQAASGA